MTPRSLGKLSNDEHEVESDGDSGVVGVVPVLWLIGVSFIPDLFAKSTREALI